MLLKTQLDSISHLPEAIQDLYSPSNGGFKLTGIEGIKTQEDINALSGSLANERAEHKATRARLAKWRGMNFNDTQARLDSIPALEAELALARSNSTNGDLDSTVDRLTNLRMSGANRQISALKAELDELKTANASLVEEEHNRTIVRAMREAAIAAGVQSCAISDAEMLATTIMQLDESGCPVTRDGVGVIPGLDASQLLIDLKESRAHWWAGDAASTHAPSMQRRVVGKNYWTKEHWNMSLQNQLCKDDMPAARRMAAAAGVEVDALNPPQ